MTDKNVRRRKNKTPKVIVKKIHGAKIIKRNFNKKVEIKPIKKRNKSNILIYIMLFLIFLAILITGMLHNRKYNTLICNLIGKSNITIEVFNKYKEEGINLKRNKKDLSSDIKIIGRFNTNKLGKYKLEYYYNDKLLKTRIINVVDKTKPLITLNGEDTIKLIRTSIFTDPLATSTDNYDGDLTDKIEVTGTVDINVVGEYIINYTVKDSSNNESTISRKVIIEEEPKQIIKVVPREEERYIPPVIIEQGKVTSASFNNKGIYIRGCATTNEIPKEILLNDKIYNITDINGNCYNVNIDLTSLPNGTYPILLKTNVGTSNIVNTLSNLARIGRAKLNNKLVSIDYGYNNMKVNISDFSYQYDVIIDAGHGGSDTGATNQFITEKQMNLEVSLYEKSLFEKAGYRVLLVRSDDSYGNGIYVDSKALYNRAYYMGYYGVVSKIVYSNHHNALSNASVSGFEMYITNQASNINTEINIYNSVKNVFKANGIFSRNYDSGIIYNKTDGRYIDVKNYYAVIRVPYELFNIDNILIYEGCYISNVNDYITYWNNGLWKKISEIKVNNYIEKIKRM